MAPPISLFICLFVCRRFIKLRRRQPCLALSSVPCFPRLLPLHPVSCLRLLPTSSQFAYLVSVPAGMTWTSAAELKWLIARDPDHAKVRRTPGLQITTWLRTIATEFLEEFPKHRVRDHEAVVKVCFVFRFPVYSLLTSPSEVKELVLLSRRQGRRCRRSILRNPPAFRPPPKRYAETQEAHSPSSLASILAALFREDCASSRANSCGLQRLEKQ